MLLTIAFNHEHPEKNNTNRKAIIFF